MTVLKRIVFGLFITVTPLVCSPIDNNVYVNKCCKFNEVLVRDELICKTVNTTINWRANYLTFKQKPAGVPPAILSGLPPNWKLQEDVRPNCEYFQYLQRLHSFVSFENGSMYVSELGLSIEPPSFCLDVDIVLVCKEKSEFFVQPGVRVNRCCGKHAAYSEKKRSCEHNSKDNRTISVPSDTVLYEGFPSCSNLVLAGRFNESKILANGSLELLESKKILPQDGYCLEFIKENSDDSASVFACKQYIAHDEPLKIGPDIRFTLYPIALTFSVIFLAATLIAGFLLPASHHVLHWRCQTNHVLCLLLGDIFLCIVQFSGHSIQGITCTMMAVSMHFLFLAAFFWLNTMCFNIWWTFRDLRPQNLEKSQERCRLRLYEVYAWGFPALIALTGLILDVVPGEALRPGFGIDKCWFHGNVEIFTYFFGPIGILLTINLTLFAATARELTCGLWKRELVKSTTERAALGRVCIKLVVVMGVSWIADIISWLVGGPQEVWYFTDIINCLSGVFIFIVVGCQPQVLSAVKRYWCWRNNNNTAETAGTTNHHSSSSQGQPSIGDTVCNHSITNNTKSVALETSC